MTERSKRQSVSARFRSTLRALHSYNYRLFFFGQGVSLIGTWMQMLAAGWLVNRLSRDVLLLGLVAFASRGPAAVLTPVAGVLVDRYDKRTIVTVAQALSMVQALAMAILTLTGVIQIWHVMVLSAGLGIVSAIEIPARQAFIVDMVEDRADLPNAIALNSSLFNGARLMGPVLAGICVYNWGEGICFLLNALSYIAVIIALLKMTTKPHERQAEYPSVLQGFREGLAYACSIEPLLLLLLLLSVVSLVAMPYQVLMPRFATASLHVDERGFGYLTAAGGLGALLGALYLAQLPSVRGLGRLVPRATWVFGIGLILLGDCRTLWLALVLMAVVGAGMMVQMASANTVLQTVVSDDKRGRLMSLHVMAFMGTAPLGSLWAGHMGQYMGVPRTLQLSGVLAILAAIAYQFRLPGVARRLPADAPETALLAEVLNAPLPGRPMAEAPALSGEAVEAAVLLEELEESRTQD